MAVSQPTALSLEHAQLKTSVTTLTGPSGRHATADVKSGAGRGPRRTHPDTASGSEVAPSDDCDSPPPTLGKPPLDMNDSSLTGTRNRGASTDRDLARSHEPLREADLSRLGRVADAELDAFFTRNPRLVGWRDRVRIIAVAQGGAEHYLRAQRGVWDLDVIVCFAEDPALPRLLRRMVVSWDWAPHRWAAAPTTLPRRLSRSARTS